MIVTRTPLRLPLGGGGTDLPSYYSQHGGFLVTAGINKYVDLAVNRRFESSIRVSYSQTEIVDTPDQVQHPIVRAALNLTAVAGGVEIVSIADIPSNTGLGTSSSFTVGLLKALYTFKHEDICRRDLAEQACHLEINMLGEPIGKQDQYAAAFGGVICLTISPDGQVAVEQLQLSDDALDHLESNTLMFYTGVRRSASDILRHQNQSTKRNEEQVVNSLHRIKEIGRAIRDALVSHDLDEFGRLMHQHWRVKRQLSSRISDPSIDGWYDLAMANGAIGGKLVGAGGGGFMVFYCNGHKPKLRAIMQQAGLREVRFRVDNEGSKVLVNT